MNKIKEVKGTAVGPVGRFGNDDDDERPQPPTISHNNNNNNRRHYYNNTSIGNTNQPPIPSRHQNLQEISPNTSNCKPGSFVSQGVTRTNRQEKRQQEQEQQQQRRRRHQQNSQNRQPRRKTLQSIDNCNLPEIFPDTKVSAATTTTTAKRIMNKGDDNCKKTRRKTYPLLSKSNCKNVPSDYACYPGAVHITSTDYNNCVNKGNNHPCAASPVATADDSKDTNTCNNNTILPPSLVLTPQGEYNNKFDPIIPTITAHQNPAYSTSARATTSSNTRNSDYISSAEVDKRTFIDISSDNHDGDEATAQDRRQRPSTSPLVQELQQQEPFHGAIAESFDREPRIRPRGSLTILTSPSRYVEQPIISNDHNINSNNGNDIENDNNTNDDDRTSNTTSSSTKRNKGNNIHQIKQQRLELRKIHVFLIILTIVVISLVLVVSLHVSTASSSSSAGSSMNNDTNSSPSNNSTSNHNNNSTSSSNKTTLISRYDSISSFLINTGIIIDVDNNTTNTTSLLTPSSPQQLALDWIVNNDTIYSIDPLSTSMNTNNVRLIQRYVLAVFFFSTNKYNDENNKNSKWILQHNWLSPTTKECSWKYVICDYSKEHIIGIDIRKYNNIHGPIPYEISLLPSSTSIKKLTLMKNSITDIIPLCELNNLQTLHISENSNTFISTNHTIPSCIYNIPELQVLKIINSKIYGTISSNISNLIHLTNLSLSGNHLSGTIPSELYTNLPTYLQELDLGSTIGTNMKLRGNISDIIVGLSGSSNSSFTRELEVFDIQGNDITGSIPKEIYKLSKLRILKLGDNKITGSIPSEIGLLTDLTTLDLSYNKLNGTIPSEIGNLSSLKTLGLDENDDITGVFPEEICNLRTDLYGGPLFSLYIGCNLQCPYNYSCCEPCGNLF